MLFYIFPAWFGPLDRGTLGVQVRFDFILIYHALDPVKLQVF